PCVSEPERNERKRTERRYCDAKSTTQGAKEAHELHGDGSALAPAMFQWQQSCEFSAECSRELRRRSRPGDPSRALRVRHARGPEDPAQTRRVRLEAGEAAGRDGDSLRVGREAVR